MEKGFTVLVVDDKADNIKVINSLLREMDLGRNVYSAPNGKIALELAKKFLPDLILADWQMPEMNGLELLKSLKASPSTQDIPFIMITAVKIDPASMKASFDAGVHDYLRKPFDKLEFFARVGATLKLQKAYLNLQQSQEEIQKQANLISKQHIELQKVNQLKDNILLAISHDLRSPLATLDSILDVFHDEGIDLSPEELVEYTAMIHEDVKHTVSLLDSLLFWSKTQLYDEKVSKSSFDVSLIAAEIAQLFTLKVAAKQIQLISMIPPKTVITCNSSIISFILRNLIDNAIKFTPVGGTIKINFDKYPDHEDITVTDTGKGMEAKALNDFFGDNSTTSTVGTLGEMGNGIGLKLCKDFAKEIGAALMVQSSPEQGTTFRLRC